jgi:S1-C subfamily serine protease
LTFLVIVFTATSAFAESLQELYKRICSAVAVVRVPGEVGSGVLIDDKGHVMTAHHVVETAEEVTVEFHGKGKIRARVIRSDPGADVALLRAERVPFGVTPVRLGDSDKTEVADPVFIIGAPLGLSYSVTTGIVSSRRNSRTLYGSMGRGELFQTDAAINPGNSGGPMFNMRGEVIGIVSHILTKGGGSEGLGFAVTSNSARRLLLEDDGFWTGTEVVPVRDDLARLLNVPQPEGLLVQKVAPNSPAAALGLKGGVREIQWDDEWVLIGGDILLSINGIEFRDENEESIRRSMARYASGGSLTVRILRGGKILELAARK